MSTELSSTEPTSRILLECRELSAGYGEIAVVHHLDLKVEAGQVVTLVGANGAGKSTTLLTLAGAMPPLGGEVLLFGSPTRAPLHQRARAGLSLVTEERSVIMELTAAQNLRLAKVSNESAISVFPELQRLLHRPAGMLSGGEQQMLTVARALRRRAKLLLADELSLGLAPRVVERLLAALRAAADEQGVGVLLVEQHIRQALAVADYGYVMQRGRVVLSGPASELRDRQGEIEKWYLAAQPNDADLTDRRRFSDSKTSSNGGVAGENHRTS